MGNITGCTGSRTKPQKSAITQLKLQDLMGEMSVQEFERTMKRFACDGVLSVKQLQEVLSFHRLRSRNNALLRDVLLNPFFRASKEETERALAAEEADATK